MSSLVSESCNTTGANSKSNGELQIRSSSSAIWNAGLRTHRIECGERSPLPSTRWNVISHALAFHKRTVAMRCLPNASFFKMLPSVTCGRKQRAPVFKSTCFSNRSKTASYPPLVTTWLDKSAAIGLFFSLREGFSLFPLGIGSFLSSRQLYIFALCYPRLDNGTDTSHPYADTRLLAKCDCPVFSRIEISPQKKGTPNLRPYHSTSLVLRIGLP